MNKVKWLFGTFLVSLPDLASGVIVASFCLLIFHRWDNIVYVIIAYFVGVFAAIAPDLDLVYSLLMGAEIRFDHRLILHKPILWLIPGLVLVCISPFFAILLTVCFMAHFVDDTFGNSQEFGVQAFWPFSFRTFVFFTNKSATGQDTERLHLYRSWVPAEFPMPVHEEELGRYYLSVTPKTVFTAFWSLLALVMFLFIVVLNVLVYW